MLCMFLTVFPSVIRRSKLHIQGQVCVRPIMLHAASLTWRAARTGHLKCDGTRTETRVCLPAKRTSPFKSAGASVQSTAGSRGVRISSSNAGYTMFRGSVKGTGYPLHSSVSPSIPLPASPCASTFQLESSMIGLTNT